MSRRHHDDDNVVLFVRGGQPVAEGTRKQKDTNLWDDVEFIKAWEIQLARLQQNVDEKHSGDNTDIKNQNNNKRVGMVEAASTSLPTSIPEEEEHSDEDSDEDSDENRRREVVRTAEEKMREKTGNSTHKEVDGVRAEVVLGANKRGREEMEELLEAHYRAGYLAGFHAAKK